LPDSELTAQDQELLDAAMGVRGNAYAPISNYRVGAAIRMKDGGIVVGCNVEHIILGMTSCAEVVAVQSAVAGGNRDFGDCAVITSSSPPATPCGNCRQLLNDWGVERVICGNVQGEVRVFLLSELLPHSFELREPLPPDSE